MFMPDILNKLSSAREIAGGDLRLCEIFKPENSFIFTSNHTDNVSNAILLDYDQFLKNFLQICNDSVDLDAYKQTIFVGVGYLIGFIILALIISSHTRRYILGEICL